MIRFRVVILTVLVMTCALRLHAGPQPSDPRMIVNGGHLTPVGSDTPVGLDFSFMANSSGGGIFKFTNDSGVDWTSLGIFVSTPPTDMITCGGSSFATCVVLPKPLGDFAFIEFSGGGGILDGQTFTIDLEGWAPNEQFRAFANVPEPSTLALSLICLTPLLVRRFTISR
ncbi:MAG: hypothetical protein WCC92_16255 [Candidatus Korobacteraceae bacterium]